MKKSASIAAKWLFGIVAPLIITSWIAGKPLDGLIKLKGLGDTFLKSTVPAWAFTVVFVVALIAGEYAIEHTLKGRTKKVLHLIPDPDECSWGQAAEREQGGKKVPVMFVRVQGTLTFDGDREIQFLSAYLKGTQLSGMRTRVPAIDGNGEVEISPVQLTPHVPQHVSMDLWVWPMSRTAKTSFRHHVILRDQYNREHDLGSVEFKSRG